MGLYIVYRGGGVKKSARKLLNSPPPQKSLARPWNEEMYLLFTIIKKSFILCKHKETRQNKKSHFATAVV